MLNALKILKLVNEKNIIKNCLNINFVVKCKILHKYKNFFRKVFFYCKAKTLKNA
jgi:hypothetical protein